MKLRYTSLLSFKVASRTWRKLNDLDACKSLKIIMIFFFRSAVTSRVAKCTLYSFLFHILLPLQHNFHHFERQPTTHEESALQHTQHTQTHSTHSPLKHTQTLNTLKDSSLKHSNTLKHSTHSNTHHSNTLKHSTHSNTLNTQTFNTLKHSSLVTHVLLCASI